MRLNRVGVKSAQIMALALIAFMLPTTLLANEPIQLIEEVTVVGAVRGSGSTAVADIDVAGDESLEEMPTLYE